MSQALAQTAPVDPEAAADASAASAPESVDHAVRVDPDFVPSQIETSVSSSVVPNRTPFAGPGR